MDADRLKLQLIASGYAEDNEWLNRYVELIFNNRHTSRTPKLTHKHHIFPVSYYRYRHLPVDNSSDNLVNLSFKDHMKAHLFLSGCTKGQERYKNLYSVFQMSHFDVECYIEIQNYDYYQELYVDAINAAPNHRKGTKVSSSTHERMCKAAKLRAAVYGSATEGTIWVTDGHFDKMISPADLDEYIAQGYSRGRSFRHSNSAKQRIGQHSHERIVTDKFRERMREIGKESNMNRDPESYKRQGRALSEYYKSHRNPFAGCTHTLESNERNRQAHLGRKHIHKCEIGKVVFPEELDQYLSDGWELGRAARTHN